jgi:DNA-binding sugar fermentation-stimulating protein
MADSKHSTLSYDFENRQNRFIIPVQIHSVPFNSMLSVSANALWDTGAMMSAITPEIRDKLKATAVNRKKIAGIHTAQEVDIVAITIELPNRVVKKSIEVAVCNMTSNIGMILGMDIISLGDFALSNGNDQTLFSFAVPPYQDKIDFSKRQHEL